MQEKSELFLANIRANPHDEISRLVYSDWLQENDRPFIGWRSTIGTEAFGLPFLLDGYGYGYGYGNGDGDGDGYGNGNGYGNGDGDGYGDGDGDGDGNGNGYGNGYGKLIEGLYMAAIVGENQALILPHGFVICGHVEEQIGPNTYRVSNASMICRTGGTPWDELFDGKGRGNAIFRKWGDVCVACFLSRKWVGDLP